MENSLTSSIFGSTDIFSLSSSSEMFSCPGALYAFGKLNVVVMCDKFLKKNIFVSNTPITLCYAAILRFPFSTKSHFKRIMKLLQMSYHSIDSEK